MQKNKPKTYTDLSDNAQGSLKFIFDNLSKIKQLEQIVKAKLDPKLREHCSIINYRDNIIVIATQSANWATRLKYQLPELLSQLRSSGFPGLKSIDVLVQPDLPLGQ
ncbi:MAG: DciA family protein [Kangiellaceae bacterium]|jgi:hypothetical protein|nr:DciA family protein [Kangiellaceae bacterium]